MLKKLTSQILDTVAPQIEAAAGFVWGPYLLIPLLSLVGLVLLSGVVVRETREYFCRPA